MPFQADEQSSSCLYILQVNTDKDKGSMTVNILATGGWRACNSAQSCPSGSEAAASHQGRQIGGSP